MEFLRMLLQYDGKTRDITFTKKHLIFSENNSLGKSTLLRFLFYGLGYPVPGTTGIKFGNVDVTIEFFRNDSTYKVHRYGDFIEIQKDDKPLRESMVSDIDGAWFALVWGTDIYYVLKNILGALYMDQDKGWTLLNRGKVIGGIHFNVRDLLLGLTGMPDYLVEELHKLDGYKKLRKQTRQLLELDKSIDSYQSDQIFDTKTDTERATREVQLSKELLNINLQLKVLKKEYLEVKRQIEEQDGLRKYIISLHLIIEIDGEQNVITEENLDNFKNNIDFLKYKAAKIQQEMIQKKERVSDIKTELGDKTDDLFKEEDVVASTIRELSKVKFDSFRLEAKIEELDGLIKESNEKVENLFLKNEDIINETMGWIETFSSILGVQNYIKNKRYVFTRDLKSISGTVFYKIVFSFKMAYIKVIESHTGIVLPIVLDSPSGREVTERNINEVMGILNRYFKDNQIIISSIRTYDLDGLETTVIRHGIFGDL